MPRESDSKRHRSKYDREPSPKRSRGDGKPGTERSPRRINNEIGAKDKDQKQRRRLQDALPLEAPPAPDSKAEAGDLGKESDRKANGYSERTKHSDASAVPQSRSYFQKHDERSNAGQDSRTSGHRETSERGWWRDSKHDQRAIPKTATSDVRRRDEKFLNQGDDSRVWRHDKFFETQVNPPPPAKKRPPFREEKLPVEAESTEKAATEPTKPLPPLDRPAAIREKRVERGGQSQRDRSYVGDGSLPNRGRAEKASFPSRDRYSGGGGRYGGRDRYSGRQGYHSGGSHVEKWKHDMFDEANRSPTPKKEEDPTAKLEALLAS
ncbi:hypothetical protein Nepgr_019764 [Nepenthes gracilis]|uniref:Btz domain-containing protein n=1 Tax=Nepenthes gracilis TaxID=150966 RepID=A0AAD3XUP6_NEPGR|nr:hypothetical protein Nepgr_019764 [Nepenthes gracilis]